MVEKVTKEEKLIELAILKAKEILQEAEHLGTLELEDESEEVKLKRPKKNPPEVKFDNPQVEGYGVVKFLEVGNSILKILDDLRKFEPIPQLELDRVNTAYDTMDKLLKAFKHGAMNKTKFTTEMRKVIEKLEETKEVSGEREHHPSNL